MVECSVNWALDWKFTKQEEALLRKKGRTAAENAKVESIKANHYTGRLNLKFSANITLNGEERGSICTSLALIESLGLTPGDELTEEVGDDLLKASVTQFENGVYLTLPGKVGLTLSAK